MSIPIIGFDEGEARLDWLRLSEALAAGHGLPKAEIGDTFLRRGGDTLLSRAAWIDGLGALVKTATIHPGNTEAGLPTINGAVSLFDDRTGVLKAMVDFHLVTKWKTAGDSLLGALRLARKDARNVLIVGGCSGHLFKHGPMLGDYVAGVGLQEWGTAPRFKIGPRTSMPMSESPSGR